ncbi:class I SAM-dependent methyltransferase [Auritidibacter ignavus]|uniref:class I SAM-dependent methyltransferase n=1 Tax=Auritidibacter ignavus TaxID=678932 RepID=UPI002FE58FC0
MNKPLHSPFREIVAYVPGVVRSSLYKGYFARFYAEYTSLIDSDIQWYRKAIGRKQKLRVLDLFSGTGRIAEGLAEDGHECTAVEVSPDMTAGKNTSGARVRRILGDVFDFPGSAEYDSVVTGQMSVAMFLDDSERFHLFHHIWSHLKQGGRLVFDMPLPPEADSEDVIGLPLLSGERGYVLSGVFRDVENAVQTTYFLAEVDAADAPTSRILASHQLALLNEATIRVELESAGFYVEQFEISKPAPLQPGLSAPVAQISAVKRSVDSFPAS